MRINKQGNRDTYMLGLIAMSVEHKHGLVKEFEIKLRKDNIPVQVDLVIECPSFEKSSDVVQQIIKKNKLLTKKCNLESLRWDLKTIFVKEPGAFNMDTNFKPHVKVELSYAFCDAIEST